MEEKRKGLNEVLKRLLRPSFWKITIFIVLVLIVSLTVSIYPTKTRMVAVSYYGSQTTLSDKDTYQTLGVVVVEGFDWIDTSQAYDSYGRHLRVDTYYSAEPASLWIYAIAFALLYLLSCFVVEYVVYWNKYKRQKGV